MGTFIIAAPFLMLFYYYYYCNFFKCSSELLSLCHPIYGRYFCLHNGDNGYEKIVFMNGFILAVLLLQTCLYLHPLSLLMLIWTSSSSWWLTSEITQKEELCCCFLCCFLFVIMSCFMSCICLHYDLSPSWSKTLALLIFWDIFAFTLRWFKECCDM